MKWTLSFLRKLFSFGKGILLISILTRVATSTKEFLFLYNFGDNNTYLNYLDLRVTVDLVSFWFMNVYFLESSVRNGRIEYNTFYIVLFTTLQVIYISMGNIDLFTGYGVLLMSFCAFGLNIISVLVKTGSVKQNIFFNSGDQFIFLILFLGALLFISELPDFRYFIALLILVQLGSILIYRLFSYKRNSLLLYFEIPSFTKLLFFFKRLTQANILLIIIYIARYSLSDFDNFATLFFLLTISSSLIIAVERVFEYNKFDNSKLKILNKQNYVLVNTLIVLLVLFCTICYFFIPNSYLYLIVLTLILFQAAAFFVASKDRDLTKEDFVLLLFCFLLMLILKNKMIWIFPFLSYYVYGRIKSI
jgi:hypothetical protein